MRVSSTTAAAPPAPAPPPVAVPMSLGEEQVSFLQGLVPGGRPLTVAVGLTLTGPLDEARLDRAWATVRDRHPHLGPAPSSGGDPLPLDPAPLDPERGPLLRAVLHRDDPGRARLLLIGHRIAFDEPALRSLLDQLGEQYAVAGPRPAGPAAPGLPVRRAPTGRSAAWRAQPVTEVDELALDPDGRLIGESEAVAGAGWTERVRRHRLPAPLGSRLAVRAAELDARPRDLITAALYALLARHTGRHDLRIGIPVSTAGEPRRPGVVPVPAYLALGARPGLRTSFAAAAGGFRDAALELAARQDPRLRALLAGSAYDEPHAGRPLLHAVVVDAPPAQKPGAWGPLTAAWADPGGGVTPFPLTLALQPGTGVGAFRTTLTLRADRFSLAYAHRLVERWSVLLAAALAEPATELGRLPMLPIGERSTLVSGWSRTGETAPDIGFVHASVQAWARRTPDAVALVQGAEELTFAALNGRANGLARRLRAAGVGRDVPVAVYDDPSIGAVLGLLAVLKAGGCYVPLDLAYPEPRLRDIVSAVRPAVFLTRPDLRERLDRLRGAVPGPVLLPDTDLDDPATPDLDVAVDPADLGYVLHTSGSTGQPKGIAMPHESLRRTLAWYPAETGIVAGARLLQYSPFGFDSHFCEIFGTWHAGATVVLPANNELRRDPEALLRLLAAERIDHLEAPNSGLANLAHWAVHQGGGAGLRLRTLVSGGEQLLVTPDLLGWLAELPGCAVRHGYGPTESGPTTSYWLPGGREAWPGVPPIGRPVTDARVYLLDDALQPVPPGVPGEMYVGGPVLARGYLNAPARSAERFVADPVGPAPGGRLYRTGDLARWTSGGVLEFLGRNDGQVKVRGYRIELAEVEAVLLTHPRVAAAAVVVAPDGESLVGHVVPTGSGPTAADLQRHVAHRLPAFMVPATFSLVARLPTTPSGKLDRARLARGG